VRLVRICVLPPFDNKKQKTGARRVGNARPQAPKLQEMGDAEAIETVAQFLEDNAYPFTPEEIHRAIQRKRIHVKGDIEAFIREVQERGLAKTRGVLEALGDFLGIPSSSLVLEEAEKWLRDGAELVVRGPRPHIGVTDLEVAIKMYGGSADDTVRSERFPSTGPHHHLLSEVFFSFSAKAGLETLLVFSSVYGVRGRVTLSASSPRHLEEHLEVVRGLRPLFSMMELSDLDGAIERLLELERGESRIEGPYVLVQGKSHWGGDVWALRRGPIFGDPEVDGALLLDKEVGISFPGDVEFSFRVKRVFEVMGLQRLRIRWGDEEVNFRYPHLASAPYFAKNPVAEAIQSALMREIAKLEAEGKSEQFEDLPSLRMLTFLKAFSKHEDPFGALAEGRLFAHVKAEFFMDL
jgi:hypothetical protein